LPRVRPPGHNGRPDPSPARRRPPLLAGLLASALSPRATIYVASALVALAGVAFVRLFEPIEAPVE